jgi:hypothetical protein
MDPTDNGSKNIESEIDKSHGDAHVNVLTAEEQGGRAAQIKLSRHLKGRHMQ